jgi:cation diffusion facilitator CzcD-associated flavoprotein CzcO
VAVVGTGASAIQLVPSIAPDVASLAVFQRSAPYVVPKPDAPNRRVHRTLLRLPAAISGERRGIFGLTEVLNGALEGQSWWSRPVLRAVEVAWRLQLRAQVPDPDLRRRLVPDYPLGCKRVLFSSDWYPALAQRHVALVTERIERIEPRGVRTADGTLHEADVLIWGTGFAASTFLAPMQVTGVGGADLHRDAWADGAHAHLGVTVPGFPNLFCVYGPNTNLGGSSIIGMMEAQAGWIAEVVGRLRTGEVRAVAVRPEAAAAYDEEMQGRLGDSVWASCDSWYRDGGRITTNWPGLVSEYQRRLDGVDWSELEVS